MRTVNSRMSIAIHCLVFIHEYGEKTKVTGARLSLSTGCNPVVIRNILSALKKAGLISAPKGPGGAKLCLPPAQISLRAVYAALALMDTLSISGIHADPSALCPVGRNIHALLENPYRQLENAVLERMQAISLQDILDDYHRISEKGS